MIAAEISKRGYKKIVTKLIMALIAALVHW